MTIQPDEAPFLPPPEATTRSLVTFPTSKGRSPDPSFPTPPISWHRASWRHHPVDPSSILPGAAIFGPISVHHPDLDGRRIAHAPSVPARFRPPPPAIGENSLAIPAHPPGNSSMDILVAPSPDPSTALIPERAEPMPSFRVLQPPTMGSIARGRETMTPTAAPMRIL